MSVASRYMYRNSIDEIEGIMNCSVSLQRIPMPIVLLQLDSNPARIGICWLHRLATIQINCKLVAWHPFHYPRLEQCTEHKQRRSGMATRIWSITLTGFRFEIVQCLWGPEPNPNSGQHSASFRDSDLTERGTFCSCSAHYISFQMVQA